jgi:hypothetical protein
MSQPFASSRKPRPFRAAGAPRRAASGAGSPSRPQASGQAKADKPEHEILFQTYFKSVGPRTYAAQVKKASNDNHYLVLTEGKRDEKTGEVRKARLFVYSEDFVAFFRMLQDTAQFIRANPVPDDVKKRRDRFWTKKNAGAGGKGSPQAPGAAPSRPAAGATRASHPTATAAASQLAGRGR